MRRAAAGIVVVLASVLAVPAAVAEDPAPDVRRVAGADRVQTAVALSRAVFASAPAAVLARADDFADALVGAPLAAELGGPILLTARERLPATVRAELERLGVESVTLLGGERAVGPAVEAELAQRYAVTRVAGSDRYGTAAQVARMLAPGPTVIVATGRDFPDALAAAPWAARSGHPILLVAAETPAATAEALGEREPEEVVVVGGPAAVPEAVADELGRHGTVRRVAGSSRYGTAAAVYGEEVRAGLEPARTWLATGENFPDALAAGPAAAAAGAGLLLVRGVDVGLEPAPAALLSEHADAHRELVLVGGAAALSGEADRQLDVVRAGRLLPRGGTSLFPHFRVVAHFGGPQDPRLGILGHGTPDDAGRRVVEHTRPYHAPARPVLPAFELIATIATRDPGPHGHYSRALEPDAVQAYLDAARRHGLLLVLDIQPGRSDFLTELRRHEPFLVEPDVGVALDPEWRMQPHERPGERVGHVEAAEVNAVSAYLAGLVGQYRLPDKLFVLHQFQHQMIRDRPAIEQRAGLAMTIHMDGFGSREQKLATYRQVRADPPWWNGFKVFLDQDTNPFQPHEVMALDPSPDFVSYQ